MFLRDISWSHSYMLLSSTHDLDDSSELQQSVDGLLSGGMRWLLQ